MLSRRIIFWEEDAQADFVLPGGKLYVPGAEKIIPNIKRLVEAAVKERVLLVSSADAHSENDPEFQRFPPHCVKGTPGAHIIPEGLAKSHLIVPNDPAFRLPENVHEYSQVVFEKQTLDVFDNPHACTLVKRLGANAEYCVFGVATEFCVRYVTKGLLKRGFLVSVVKDAVAALGAEAGRRALDELQDLGAKLITTSEVLAKIGADGLRNSHRKSAHE